MIKVAAEPVGRLIVGGLLVTAALLTSRAGRADPPFYQNHFVTKIERIPVTFPTTTMVRAVATLGIDPVLHILNTDNVQVAGNDDISPPDRTAQVTVGPGSYYVIVRAYSDFSRGTVSLERSTNGGATWVAINSAASAGGSLLPIAPAYTATDYMNVGMQTVTGAMFDSVLYTVTAGSQGGTIKAYDDDSGLGLSPIIHYYSPDTSIDRLLVGGWGGDGVVNVVANDVGVDYDGDGLGANLESAIGTCEAGETTGICQYAASTTDSDRDGLLDSEEVIGIGDPVAVNDLFLPAWGADPLAKDVFVEIDWATGASWPPGTTFPPFTDGHATYAALRFGSGTASELLTPGRNAVRMHFDIGRSCSAQKLCGNWGGGGTALTDHLDRAMQSVREGIFRYVVVTPGGGGQTSADKRHISAGLESPAAEGAKNVVHELGHSFGLHHHGHDLWGPRINCKPNYNSLMNYGITDASVFEFSHGAMASSVVNGSWIDEEGTLGGFDTTYLADPDNAFRHWIATSSGTVDFNRDGKTAAGAVRAGPTLAAGSCGTARNLATDLTTEVAFWPDETTPPPLFTTPVVSPAMVRVSDTLFAFWVNGFGSVEYTWTGVTGPNGVGSCLNDGSTFGQCEQWQPFSLPSSASGSITGLAVTRWNEEVVVAYRTSDGNVWVVSSPNPMLSVWSSPVMVASGTAADTDVEIAPVFVSTAFYPAEVVLGVFYSQGGVYAWKFSTSSSGPWLARPLAKTDGSLVAGYRAPSLASYPNTYQSTGPTDPNDRTCGAFPDPTNVVHLLCYQKATDQWTDVTTGFGPDPSQWPKTSAKKPALAYHTLRAFAPPQHALIAEPLAGDPSRGQFFLVVHDVDRMPHVFVSQEVGRSKHLSVTTGWKGVGFLTDEWSPTWGTAGVDLFEDSQMSSLRGIAWQYYQKLTDQRGGKSDILRLTSLPFVDGSFNIDLRDGNDFHVIEAGICRYNHRELVVGCGGLNHWGY